MKKYYLFISVFVFSVGFQIDVRSQDTIPVEVLGCDYSFPITWSGYDSTSYSMVGTDSVDVLHIRFYQMCPSPFGVYELKNDTSFIEIYDTSGSICLGNCHMKFKFRLPFPNDTLNLQILGYNFHQIVKAKLLATFQIGKFSNPLFSVYPNPLVNKFHIDLNDSMSGIYYLIDLRGQAIFLERFQNVDFITVNTQHLDSGVYYLLVEANQYLQRYKLIKI